MNIGYRKRVVALLFVLLLCRFWFSQTFELTGAEAYAWMKGRQLDWGYWDQGPLVPWSSWLGTLLYRQSELGVRWMSVNVYCLVGFLLFYLGRSWFNPRAGFYTVMLYVVLPIYAWQMLLLSEATLSVGLMALSLFLIRQMVKKESWTTCWTAALVVALATTLDWWNILWAAGFLLFHLLDPRRSGRFLGPKTFLFSGVALTGLMPFLAFRLATTGSISPLSWPMLHAHQYWEQARHLPGFLKEQLIWCGPLGVLALGSVLFIRRTGIPILREHLCVVCLPVPGLLAQGLLALLGHADQDVMAALWIPWLLVAAAIGSRYIEQSPRWKTAVLALGCITAVQTLSGFWPSSAEWWGGRFAPQPRHRNDNVAAEVARWQTETGASFLVTDSPLDASLLSFYLPLHDFVYVLPREGIHTQYDFWSNYSDLKDSNAIFLSRRVHEAPQEITRDFSQVKLLRDITITNQPTWHLFFCYHYAGQQTQ